MAVFLTILSPQYLAGLSAIISVIASAACYSWVTPIMKYLRNPESDLYMTSPQIAFMIAIIEFGQVVCCIPAGMLADKFGRKICLLISGPMYALTWVVIIFTKNYVVICIMKTLQGVPMALVFTVCPLYLGEISSKTHRGTITGFFSMAWFFGYLVEYVVGPFVSYLAFTIFTASVPVIFTIIFAFQPESPYYLLMKGKEEKALSSLRWLRKGCSEDAIRSELEEMKGAAEREMSSTSKPCWKDLIATPADRRALLILFIIGNTRILSGAMALMSYSTDLFLDTGITFLSPDLLTILMGVTFVLGSLVNAFIVDSVGRRPLIMMSCIGSFFSLFMVGTYFYMIQFYSTVDVSSFSFTVPLGVIVYCICSVVGIYPVSMTYTSELFTTKTRGKASSLSAVNLTVASFVNIEMYQLVSDNVGLYASFWFFAFICLLGGVPLYFLAPETKGKTFTQIRDNIFNPRNKKLVTEEITIKPGQEMKEIIV